MRYTVHGADASTGQDKTFDVVTTNAQAGEKIARVGGLLVERVVAAPVMPSPRGVSMRQTFVAILVLALSAAAAPATKPAPQPDVFVGITPILNQMPKDLRPGRAGWDEFTLPKVNAWAEQFKGKKIRLSVNIEYVTETPISIEGDINHVQVWEVTFGIGVAEVNTREIRGGVSLQSGTNSSITVRSDERFAKAAKESKARPLVVEGVINRLSVGLQTAPDNSPRASYGVWLSGMTVQSAGRAKSPAETYIEDHHSKPEIADAIRAGQWVAGMSAQDQMLVNDGPGIYWLEFADRFGDDPPRFVTRAEGKSDAVRQGARQAESYKRYRKDSPFYVTGVQLRVPEPDRQ